MDGSFLAVGARKPGMRGLVDGELGRLTRLCLAGNLPGVASLGTGGGGVVGWRRFGSTILGLRPTSSASKRTSMDSIDHRHL